MKWNKSSNIYFPTDKKKVLFFIFFVFSFTCNKLFYWHRQWIHLVGAGPSCTPAHICSSCWCVRLCLQYDSEVTSHLMVELVACSMTNQDLICFLKKMFCCCMYMSGGNVRKNLGDVDKVESNLLSIIKMQLFFFKGLCLKCTITSNTSTSCILNVTQELWTRIAESLPLLPQEIFTD